MFYYYGRKEKIFSYYPKPKYGTIIEPFAGKGDLLKYIHEQNENINIEAYDLAALRAKKKK